MDIYSEYDFFPVCQASAGNTIQGLTEHPICYFLILQSITVYQRRHFNVQNSKAGGWHSWHSLVILVSHHWETVDLKIVGWPIKQSHAIVSWERAQVYSVVLENLVYALKLWLKDGTVSPTTIIYASRDKRQEGKRHCSLWHTGEGFAGSFRHFKTSEEICQFFFIECSHCHLYYMYFVCHWSRREKRYSVAWDDYPDDQQEIGFDATQWGIHYI